MWLKLSLVFAALLLAFLAYVAYLPAHFRVVREMRIKAPPAVIFPHVNDVRAADAWNPFLKIDSPVEKAFSPQTTGVGAWTTWKAKGNAGKATITESRLNEAVAVRLDHQEPFRGTNVATYRLELAGDDTVVHWSIDGEASFVPRALCALRVFNMDKMIGGEFEKGLVELKKIAEAK